MRSAGCRPASRSRPLATSRRSTTRRWTATPLRAADAPGQLRVIGEVAAGVAQPPHVEPGTAVRIMTGAPMPPGADAVVPIEDAGEAGETRRGAGRRAGAYVRPAGHDTRRGEERRAAGGAAGAGRRSPVLASLGHRRSSRSGGGRGSPSCRPAMSCASPARRLAPGPDPRCERPVAGRRGRGGRR